MWHPLWSGADERRPRCTKTLPIRFAWADGSSWPFCDMATVTDKGRFRLGGGHTCKMSHARLRVHALVFWAGTKLNGRDLLVEGPATQWKRNNG